MTGLGINQGPLALESDGLPTGLARGKVLFIASESVCRADPDLTASKKLNNIEQYGIEQKFT